MEANGNPVELRDVYAHPTGDWEAWQIDYRFGAFYIFPPPGVIEPIDALRRAYDPRSDAICQTHISLSEPLPGPMTELQMEDIRAALSAVEPFDIQYGPLRDFLSHPGVCYSVAPEDKISTLRETLHATSTFRNVPLKRAHIAPHITIAEFISIERTIELLHELRGKVPEGRFRCSSVAYAVPNASSHFETIAEFRLGG